MRTRAVKFFTSTTATALTAFFFGVHAPEVLASEQIQIVGSSTVFPYSQAVAERFVGNTGADSPVLESTGTGAGMKIFCEGLDTDTVDITGASRPMKKSEWEVCARNGVTNVTEILFGIDGLSMAHSRSGIPLKVTKAHLFSALAAEVEMNGTIVANPHTRWSEIDPTFPDIPITVYGPPPTSGTRDAWVELVMVPGCKTYAAFAALPADEQLPRCSRMRTDGPFIEAGENDNLIIQRLRADPHAYGIFGFSFLYENMDVLAGVEVDGVTPTEDTVKSGEYGVSRPLFIYIKNDHLGVIPGLAEFVEELMSEDAIGPGGYLAERGLIPLPDGKRSAAQEHALAYTPMAPPEK